MPRTLAAGELWRRLTALTLYRIQTGTIGDTTTTAPVTGTGSETTVAVTSATNFTSADPCFIIGSGGVELTIIGTPNATMPVSPPPRIAQDTGARFVEAAAVSLGKVPQNSVTWTATRSLSAVFEEIGDAPVVYIPGAVEFGLQFALFGYNGPNVQTLLGYKEDETGSGAAYATAYQSPAGLPGQTQQTEQVMRVRGLRHDAKNIEVDFLNAFFEASINSQLGREQPSQLQGGVRASAIIVRQWT
jgi:hypothetical protein